MTKPSVLALIAAAALALPTLAVATSHDARAAEKKEAVQPAKPKHTASRKALQSFDQLRTESRSNDTTAIARPPAQPGAW